MNDQLKHWEDLFALKFQDPNKKLLHHQEWRKCGHYLMKEQLQFVRIQGYW